MREGNGSIFLSIRGIPADAVSGIGDIGRIHVAYAAAVAEITGDPSMIRLGSYFPAVSGADLPVRINVVLVTGPSMGGLIASISTI